MSNGRSRPFWLMPAVAVLSFLVLIGLGDVGKAEPVPNDESTGAEAPELDQQLLAMFASAIEMNGYTCERVVDARLIETVDRQDGLATDQWRVECTDAYAYLVNLTRDPDTPEYEVEALDIVPF
jgi:hypothetical protein